MLSKSLMDMVTQQAPPTLRCVARFVAIFNLAYFGIEFAVALAIGSVSLFADSDFLEDTSVNFLILVALDWSMYRRARLGMALAGILLVPGLATVWTAWNKVPHTCSACSCATITDWCGCADRVGCDTLLHFPL